VTGLYGRQRFYDTAYTDIPNSNYALLDASFAYEFPRKRGTAFLTITNAFDRHVTAVTELFAIPQVVPRRLVRAGVTWQF
jgi:outer membrane receptor protein involved in Fe transport